MMLPAIVWFLLVMKIAVHNLLSLTDFWRWREYDKEIKNIAAIGLQGAKLRQNNDMEYTKLGPRVQDGSITIFADDVFKKYIILSHRANDAHDDLLAKSMKFIGEKLTEGGLAQNLKKHVVIPNLRSHHLNKAFYNAKFAYSDGESDQGDHGALAATQHRPVLLQHDSVSWPIQGLRPRVDSPKVYHGGEVPRAHQQGIGGDGGEAAARGGSAWEPG